MRTRLDNRRLEPILSAVARIRPSAIFLVLAAVALVAGPGMRLHAALPCNDGPPMACCGGPADDGGSPAPCGCVLKPAAPSPAVVNGAQPDAVLDAAPPAPFVEADPTPALPEAVVAPQARAAPLFVLFATFLN